MSKNNLFWNNSYIIVGSLLKVKKKRKKNKTYPTKYPILNISSKLQFCHTYFMGKLLQIRVYHFNRLS